MKAITTLVEKVWYSIVFLINTPLCRLQIVHDYEHVGLTNDFLVGAADEVPCAPCAVLAVIPSF